MVPTILTMMVLAAGNPGGLVSSVTAAKAPPSSRPHAGAIVRMEAKAASRAGGLSTVLAATAIGQPEDDSDIIRRVYDLRDLAAALPEEGSIDQVADTVFALLINNTYTTLAEGVYMVDATSSEHQQAASALEMLRSLNTEGYQVRVQIIEGQIGEAFRVGDAAPDLEGAATLAVVEQMVRRRASVTIAATNRSDYIADWSPIVSDNAVGYDPDFKTLEDGLMGTLLVGAGDDNPDRDAGRVRVQLNGELRSGDLVESAVQAPGAGVVSELPIFMARQASRGMDLRASVPLGMPTIIGVLQGFGSESQIAVVVEVRRAE